MLNFGGGAEDDGTRPISRCLLELVTYQSVCETAEALLGDWRSAEITAESLQAFSVISMDGDLGVEIDALNDGSRLIGRAWLGSTSRSEAAEARSPKRSIPELAAA